MGDGRYYTYSQFFNILFLVASISYLLITTSSLYFRNRKNNQLKYVIYIQCFYILLMINRFLEEVIFDAKIGYIFKTVESLCFIWILGFSIVYFSIPDKAGKRVGYIYIAVVLILSLLFNNIIPVKAYTFYDISYNKLFSLMILIGFILSVLSKFLSNRAGVNQSEEKTLHLLWIAILFPITAFFLSCFASGYYNFYSYLLPISTFFIYRLCSYELPSQVITKVYNQLEESLDEVIIVTNTQGKVVYHNLMKHPAKCLIFLSEYIDYNLIGEIFISKDISINRHEDGLTIIIKDAKRSFFAMQTPIHQNKHLMGYLILLQETTELQNMIEELRLKNEEYMIKNKELQDYSNLVYRYEFEKEINILTNEINSKLGHQMIELSLVLQKAFDQMEESSGDTLDNLQDSIKLAKKNLQDVRIAVNQYKRYFEG